MSRKIYLKLIVFLVIINMLLKPTIYATSDNIAQNIQNVNAKENISVEQNNELEKENKQKEELNAIIKELTKSIKSKLKNIDEKIEEIRSIEEYQNYPAIRLNVDTPIFGLVSITNSKLKIKQEVSATDIAKGYSIRYIIKNNSIKLPEKYVAGIIVKTKDVKFDEDISLADANLSVRKLMQYSKTVDNVTEFLDNQINKIYKGYIDKSKNENITDIKRKLSKLNDDLLKQEEKLIKMHIILTDEQSRKVYTSKVENFNEISKKIKENEIKIKNILISNEDLVKVQKSVLELESKMIDYSIELDKILEAHLKDIDEKKMLIGINAELTNKKEKLQKIVKNSVKKEEITNIDNTENAKNIENIVKSNENNTEQNYLKENTTSDVNTKNDKKEENDNDNNATINDEKITQEIEVYEVVSENILTDIDEEIMKPLEEKIKKYVKEAEGKNQENENVQNSEDVQNNQSNSIEGNLETIDNQKEQENKEQIKISNEEKIQLVDDIVKLYKNFVFKENKFYLDNINNTLKNTTSRLSDLSKYTTYDILNQMRYIYLELPSYLEKYLDNTNLNSIIETKILSNNFNKELNNLLNVYVKINDIYIELNKIKENNA